MFLAPIFTFFATFKLGIIWNGRFLNFNQSPLQMSFLNSIELRFGLSAKAWEKLRRKSGSRFLSKFARHFLAYLE